MIEKPTIVIVSGLPRSGTSMMMRILEAGGLEVVTDNIRKADNDNPGGYYEIEKVKKLKKDSSWLDDCHGKVIKVISQLLFDLPDNKRYKILFIRRNMEEILAPQRIMLKRLGRTGAGISDEKMAEKFHNHLQKTENWLSSRDEIDVLYLNYNKLIENAIKYVADVNAFLDGGLDEEKMAGVVEVKLYRQRKNQGII